MFIFYFYLFYFDLFHFTLFESIKFTFISSFISFLFFDSFIINK